MRVKRTRRRRPVPPVPVADTPVVVATPPAIASVPAFHPGRQVVKYRPDTPLLGIGLPVRRESPIEFMISMMQLIPPLNVKLGYLVQKGANATKLVPYEDRRALARAMLAQTPQGPDVDVCEPCAGSGLVRVTERGRLGASARNAILQSALDATIPYVLFFDDDVMFPDITAYRLWVTAQKHPEAAAITGIYTTKVTPCEPMIYLDAESGAHWDWALGDLFPIHSAGAGVQLVNMAYVAKLAPPWFNDVVIDVDSPDAGHYRRHTWGHDRFFHMRLRDEAGGVVYADTGLLCAHWDVDTQRAYVVPPDAPCFQRPPVGEAFIPQLDPLGIVDWRRILRHDWTADQSFKGYLDWLNHGASNAGERMAMVATR